MKKTPADMAPVIWSSPDRILGHFLPFYPPNSLKNENFKKMKKCLEISFYTSTKNHEIWHVMDVIVIFHFGLYFSLYLTPLTVQKMKISKKWRNAWRYHHFTQVYQKSWSYAILFLWCVTGVIVILFWAIFLPFYPNNSPKNENFKKN